MSQTLIDSYKKATADYSRLETEQAEVGKRRATILAALADTGMSYANIADAVGLSRARTQQLIGIGKKLNGSAKPRVRKAAPAKAEKVPAAKKTPARKPLPPKTTKKTA